MLKKQVYYLIPVKELQVDIKDLIIIHDDIERSIGKFSYKSKGSAKYW